jgi:uncharacterized RDD family membrane protein YckC
MEYFLSIDGERTGPHSQFFIIEKIRDGALKGEELGWRKGAGEWKPLREFDEFSGYWQPTPQQIAVAEHVRQVARIALDTPQPWLRFWARAMDYVWFSMLLGMLLNALIPSDSLKRLTEMLSTAAPGRALLIMTLLNTGTFLLFVPLEAFWLSRRGTTPGKALLRIQVRCLDGSLPEYSQALLRSALVFVKGVALCLPIIPLFVMSWCRIRLIQLGTTSWDEQTGLRVEHGEPETWRYLIVIIVAAFIALVFASSLAAGMQGVTPPAPN